uniref:Aquaporin NIP1-1-like n=1 Tax=Nelumbo nucifera TaxID=4432 RepID=A0A822ZSF0_NELNU|nr:TPA_asm: hypothetical protein HUJ06_018109 [Nelumbo nucifera]
MDEISGTNTTYENSMEGEAVVNFKDNEVIPQKVDDQKTSKDSSSCVSVPFLQKLVAEVFATYFVIFAGCGAVVVNFSRDKVVTFPGICVAWGLVVMVMVYSVGHISGAHFNPAVTIAFATCRRFPWKQNMAQICMVNPQVPAYIAAQVLGATLASGTLRLLFDGDHVHFAGTMPTGSNFQSLVMEFLISFYLMFVISGVATDNRAVGELAGLAVGATILLNVLIAGYLILFTHKMV